MKKIWLIFFLLINGIFCFGQREIIINSVHGTGYARSMAEAEQEAMIDAKKNALQKSGISEDINYYTDLFKSETTGNYQELFSSSVFTNVRGNVGNIKVVNEVMQILTEEKMIKYEVEISCKVIEFNTKPDNTYKAKIDNIKPFYVEGELLEWSVLVSKDSWLYVFCIPQNQEDAYFVFPNEWEQSFKLEADKTYDFPKQVEYSLTIENGNEQTDRLIFVFTKEKYPFTEKITYKNICNWIFGIEPDQRIVQSFAVAIYKQQ